MGSRPQLVVPAFGVEVGARDAAPSSLRPVAEQGLRPRQKAKWLSGEALQIAVKRREAKSKGEKERYKHLNAEFQRIARRDKKPSSAINAKK